MKVTTRKHSAKRTFAGVLAAITLATAAVPVAVQSGMMTGITASAASDDPIRYEGGKIILNDDMNMVKDMSVKTILKVLDDVPYCKYLTPALETLLDSFIVTEDPTQQKLDEINGKIDCLFEKIDKMQTAIENLVRNELRIRQLLNENGFDTSKIKKDTYLITEKAFSKCYSASYNGFEDKSDAIFRGINIDAELKLDKNGKVSDQEVKFWKIGWEGIQTIISATVNRWNKSFDGNACRFQLVNTGLEIRGPKLSQY